MRDDEDCMNPRVRGLNVEILENSRLIVPQHTEASMGERAGGKLLVASRGVLSSKLTTTKITGYLLRLDD